MKKEEKTNVMRILESEGVNYIPHEYDVSDGHIDGISIAEKLNQPKERVFKTLITQGASKEYFVFCLPVDCELDLKKAAKAVEYKHMTFYEAAQLAKDADVKEMWLTHYSPSLTHPEMYMDEVRKIFPNAVAGKDSMSVELDFPEK